MRFERSMNDLDPHHGLTIKIFAIIFWEIYRMKTINILWLNDVRVAGILLYTYVYRLL